MIWSIRCEVAAIVVIVKMKIAALLVGTLKLLVSDEQCLVKLRVVVADSLFLHKTIAFRTAKKGPLRVKTRLQSQLLSVEQ